MRHRKSASTSNKIVLKFSVCSWSGDAWDPALGYIGMVSVKTTDERLKVEGPSTAITNMSSV